MTDYGVPILKTFHRETVIAVMTVVTFVMTCKMYNHFIAKPKESYSDVDITKFTILGILSVFVTKGAVTTLFERSIDLSASIGIAPSITPEVKVTTPSVPCLVKLVR